MQNRTSVTLEDESGAAAESNGARLWNTSVDLGSAMGSGSFEVCAAAAAATGGGGSGGGGGDSGDFSNQRRLHGYLYSGVEVDVCGNEGEGGGGGGGDTSKVHQCQV